MKAGNVGLTNLLMTHWKVHFNYVLIQEKVQICKVLAMSSTAQGKEAYGKKG